MKVVVGRVTSGSRLREGGGGGGGKVLVVVVVHHRQLVFARGGGCWWGCWNVKLGVVQQLRDVPLQQRVDSPPLAALPPFISHLLTFCQLL